MTKGIDQERKKKTEFLLELQKKKKKERNTEKGSNMQQPLPGQIKMPVSRTYVYAVNVLVSFVVFFDFFPFFLDKKGCISFTHFWLINLCQIVNQKSGRELTYMLYNKMYKLKEKKATDRTTDPWESKLTKSL